MKEEKVKIENSADLFKIPIDVINKTKLYNFYGKYYDKIYEEALKIERNGNVSEQLFQSKIKRIEIINFEFNFQSEFGQRLLICGSNSELGNWYVSNS